MAVIQKKEVVVSGKLLLDKLRGANRTDQISNLTEVQAGPGAEGDDRGRPK